MGITPGKPRVFPYRELERRLVIPTRVKPTTSANTPLRRIRRLKLTILCYVGLSTINWFLGPAHGATCIVFSSVRDHESAMTFRGVVIIGSDFCANSTLLPSTRPIFAAGILAFLSRRRIRLVFFCLDSRMNLGFDSENSS